jgi:phosphoglycerate dehydrogenase-like enzyme
MPSVSQASGTAVIACLCEAGDRPPHLADVEARAQVRYTDAAGLPAAIQGAQALLVWDFFSRALEDAWPHADQLRWVHVAAAGVDTLLFGQLVESDVVVTNARGVFDQPIAEFVLAAILAHAKRMHESYGLQRDRIWRHRETATVHDANVLIVGTGGIGRSTARLLRAVGANVRGAGRTARSADLDFGTVLASDRLAGHAGWADHLVLAAPLTAQTRHLVDARVLAAMKPSAHLVNVGRGPLADEAAVVTAVASGEIAAASLDVFATEPLPADSALWTTPGITVTAHMAGDVAGWKDALARQFAANAMRFLAGDPPENIVDKRQGYSRSSPGAGETP